MSKLAIIFPQEGPKSLNKAMVDISIKYYTGYFRKNNFSVADNGRQKYPFNHQLVTRGYSWLLVVTGERTAFICSK